MTGLIKVEFWDVFDDKPKVEYQAIGNCEKFKDAADYAIDYYGEENLISMMIDVVDAGLIISEEVYNQLRDERVF